MEIYVNRGFQIFAKGARAIKITFLLRVLYVIMTNSLITVQEQNSVGYQKAKSLQRKLFYSGWQLPQTRKHVEL